MSNKINFAQIKRLVMAPVILFAAGIGAADAARIPFESFLSGTFIAQGAPVDTNQDGVNGHLVLAEGSHPRFGTVNFQGVGEFEQPGMPSVCPNGNPGLEQSLVNGAVVIRTTRGGLLRTRVISGKACFDVISKRTVFVRFTSTILGGTGQFVGAEGSVATNATVNIVMGNAQEKDEGFGSVIATNKGIIFTRAGRGNND